MQGFAPTLLSPGWNEISLQKGISLQIYFDRIDVFAAKIPFPAADDGYGMGFCVGYSRIQGLIPTCLEVFNLRTYRRKL